MTSRLASPIERIQGHYPVVVIGSGYGGAIAACRLARAGQRVCVLERGREIRPGEYPTTLLGAVREMQADLRGRRIGSRTGLYDFHVNKHIHVFVGCGLGGTSLINANVSWRPDPATFQDARWPREIREDPRVLDAGFARADAMLRPTEYPPASPALEKLSALARSAASMGAPFYRPRINVTFEDGVNHAGVLQHQCVGCGDCVSGCNHGAKNTVLMNYLPDARNHGAEIYTCVAVRRIERARDHWLVHYQPSHLGRERFEAPTMFVRADTVILAAGVLGSTEILLRSRLPSRSRPQAGLSLSPRLGCGFSGNGDVLAFGYNGAAAVNGVGFGRRPPVGREPVGPCIAGVIDLRDQPDRRQGMIIQEGTIPGALASGPLSSRLLALGFALAAALLGRRTERGVRPWLRQRLSELDSLVRGAYHGAVRNSQTYLVMTHDDAGGRMTLTKHGGLRVHWPRVGDQPIFAGVRDQLAQATRALDGVFVKNPLTWLDRSLITVHPLGGCAMADDAEHGVVNHRGQVFSGPTGTAVHDGLYVMDGSVVPAPLGVNPLLTISAVAERCCALLVEERRWRREAARGTAVAGPEEAPRIGLQFTERMIGHLFTTAGQSRLILTLTIVSDDLDGMLADPGHRARIVGTVSAKALSGSPLTVTNGEILLLTVDPDAVGTRHMRYRLTLTAEDGARYHLDGLKLIHDDPGFDVWSDTTTLYVSVHEADGAHGALVGEGLAHLRWRDFLRQLRTFSVTNAAGRLERWKALGRFLWFFGRTLLEVYGGALAPLEPPRSRAERAPYRRKLRMAERRERVPFTTSDGVRLQLIRYRLDGGKGPVILSPGFGTSTLAFSIDTIETNLPEYLYAHGYDVWLLDYRASTDPELGTARTQFSIDDIAVYDYPAAVATVLRETGARTVQVLGHCVGSMTLLMSLLAGLQGVRSAICSQVTIHPTVPWLNWLKARLGLARLFDLLGIDYLSTDFDQKSAGQRLMDWVLRLYPTRKRCNNPVCRRILFMYGEVFKHDQLDAGTHEAVHEMFGVGNMKAFRQLSRIVRGGRAVDRWSRDRYVPALARLALPIAFIQGEENPIFLPRGTEKTYKLLCETNGGHLYTHHVIPTYAHMDCFIGKHAARDAFPIMLAELEKGNVSGRVTLVVARDAPDWEARLGRTFSRDERIEVIVDRRRGDRRARATVAEHERRQADRRAWSRVDERLRADGWTLV